jgi:hypothetical protein
VFKQSGGPTVVPSRLKLIFNAHLDLNPFWDRDFDTIKCCILQPRCCRIFPNHGFIRFLEASKEVNAFVIVSLFSRWLQGMHVFGVLIVTGLLPCIKDTQPCYYSSICEIPKSVLSQDRRLEFNEMRTLQVYCLSVVEGNAIHVRSAMFIGIFAILKYLRFEGKEGPAGGQVFDHTMDEENMGCYLRWTLSWISNGSTQKRGLRLCQIHASVVCSTRAGR